MLKASISHCFCLAAIIILLFQLSCGQDLQRYEFESPHMGTLVRVVFYTSDDSLAEMVSGAVFDKIEQLNDIMSDYQDDSELNRLSRSSGSGKYVPVSPELFTVLKASIELSQITGGAFDITIGPYVQLWREIRREPSPSLPADDLSEKIGKRVGYEHIKLNETEKMVMLARPGMLLDLGGIGKGFAADEALQVIQGFGISSALVDVGGDIVLGESPPGKKGWSILIPIRQGDEQSGYGELFLSNRSISTSGSLFQFVEIDGKRFSHIIDPVTGVGITEQRQVTVIASNGITSDGLASAISVMGPHNGISLVEALPDVDIYIEYEEKGRMKSISTSGFDEFINRINNK